MKVRLLLTERQKWARAPGYLLSVVGGILLYGCLWGCHRTASNVVSTEVTAVKSDGAPPAVKFTDVTREAGLDFIQRLGSCGQRYFIEEVAAGAAVIDAKGDGNPGLYFPQPQPIGVCGGKDLPWPQRLYTNDGTGHFQLAAGALPDIKKDYSLAAAVGDYDNDGKQDIFVCCYGKSHLFHNRGNGTFEDVTARSGINVQGLCTGAVWFDAEGKGRLDLYVLRYCDWTVATDIHCVDNNGKPDTCDPATYTPSTNLYFHNNGDGTFSERTLQAGFGKEKRRSLSAAAFDYDGDGKLDLVVTNDIGPNYLFHNLGGGKFEDVAMQGGIAYGRSGKPMANMGVAVGDYNASGRLSVLITTFSNESFTLYRNDNGFYTDDSAAAGISQPTLPYLGFGTGFLDTRNLGTLDLFCANGHVNPSARIHYDQDSNFKERNQLLLNDGKGHFTEDSTALPADDVRVHRGAVFADFNNDGRMDILTTATDDRPTLLRNDSPAGNWLLLRLTNRYGCATPIGTRCIATIGKTQTLLRVVLGGGSYGGSSDYRVHFGLGSAPKVDRLEIQWLSGKKQILENIAANKILTIKEPE